MFDLEPYLGRLGVADVPDGAKGLAVLQTAQMTAVPFENITPLLGDVPTLEPGALAAKLLRQGRGGYCYEQNTLLAGALTALGYGPRNHLARVRNGAAEGGARSHLAMTVEVEGARWLVDAGFGGHGPLAPLSLDAGITQYAPNGTYRIDRDADEWVLSRQVGDTWQSLYGFDEVPVREVDVLAANYLSARWDNSPFPKNLMIAAYGASGRVAMFNRRLTRGLAPDDTSEMIGSRAALQQVLVEEVGLFLTPEQMAQVWTKIENAPTSR